MTRDADRVNNLARLSRFADRTDGSRADSVGPVDIAEGIRRMREERTDHLMRVMNREGL